MSAKPDKEALKRLRSERKAWIDQARKAMKEQNQITKAIKNRLADTPGTVPEIAQALKMKTSDVLLYIAALRKYGEVVEGSKEGDYFIYQLAD